MSWQIYLHYDADTLSNLSNIGLLRRAQKSVDGVQLSSQHPCLNFTLEGYRIMLPAAGIRAASCNCAAPVCCKHILACILWLQQHAAQLLQSEPHPQQETAATVAATGLSHPEHGTTALDRALKLDPQAICQQLSKQDRLAAMRLYDAWLQDPSLCRIELADTKISFVTPLSAQPIVYFAETGFDGMLSDLSRKQQNAGHLACLGYLFAQYAKPWAWLDADLVTYQQQSSDCLSLLELDFIRQLQQLCRSLIAQGLSHLTESSILALELLNVQAKSLNLARIAAQLRNLDGRLKPMRDRAQHSDPGQVFDALASLYAELTALVQCRDATELKQRRGQVQRSYKPEQIEHLIPLGAEWWHSAGGGRGLSLCFWDVQQACLRSVTQARVAHGHTGFDRHSVAEDGIWQCSLDFLLQQQLRLPACKIGQDGQISPSAATQVECLQPLSALDAEAFCSQVQGITHWHQLDAALQPSSSLNPAPQRYFLLHIQACSDLQFNALQNAYQCWISDLEQQQLQVSIPCTASEQFKLQKMQHFIDQGSIIALLLRIEQQAVQIRCLPCSLVLAEPMLRIFSLDYHQIAIDQPTSSAKPDLAAHASPVVHFEPAADAISVLLAQTQTMLEYYANSGRQQFDPQDQVRLAQWIQQFLALGLDLLAQLLQPKSGQNFSHGLLYSRHILNLAQQLHRQLPIHSLSQ